MAKWMWALFLCVFVAVNCGKKPSPVKTSKVGNPTDAKTFSAFVSNDNPKPGQKNHYVKSLNNEYIPLGNYGADDKKIYGGTATLFLHPNNTYDFFVDALMMHKNADGTFCRGTNGEYLTKRVGKRPFSGTWAQNKKTLQLSDLGTASLVNAGGTAGINIKFLKSEILKEFSEKAHDMVPFDDADKGFNFYKFEKGEVLDPSIAKQQLDEACKNPTSTGADDANSSEHLQPGQTAQPPSPLDPKVNYGTGILGTPGLQPQGSPAAPVSPSPSPSPTPTN